MTARWSSSPTAAVIWRSASAREAPPSGTPATRTPWVTSPRLSTRLPNGMAISATTSPRLMSIRRRRARTRLCRPYSRIARALVASSTLKDPRSRVVQPSGAPPRAGGERSPPRRCSVPRVGETPSPARHRPTIWRVASPLPSVDALVREAACDAPHALCVREARATLAERRARGDNATAAALAPELRRRVQAALAPSLRPVLNATGVVLHTNLGRAPLAEAALARVQAVAAGYSNLELDIATGGRGSRQDHVAALICELTGAEAAVCVNNGAAALVLALAALAGGREIVVSRGQLVEIGDGFRIPEIVESAGARLREVGTTNRTTAADYTRAFGAQTGAVLCVHPSNYRVLGFTGEVSARALAELAREPEHAVV